MHHRVRNNLQTVAALLSMQARHADNEAIQESLREAVGRIRSIAAVHDLLSGSNLQETTLDTVMRHVVEEARINILPPGSRISITVEPSEVWVTSREATVFALLINEFIHNAVTHGFAGRTEGEIRITSYLTASGAVLDVTDNGRGFSPTFDIRSSSGLGFQIGRTLAQVDLQGSLDVLNRAEGGAIVRVTFVPARSTPESTE
jgi:two-component sensor histidine kinase